jgi:hypothetical protein
VRVSSWIKRFAVSAVLLGKRGRGGEEVGLGVSEELFLFVLFCFVFCCFIAEC